MRAPGVLCGVPARTFAPDAILPDFRSGRNSFRQCRARGWICSKFADAPACERGARSRAMLCSLRRPVGRCLETSSRSSTGPRRAKVCRLSNLPDARDDLRIAGRGHVADTSRTAPLAGTSSPRRLRTCSAPMGCAGERRAHPPTSPQPSPIPPLSPCVIPLAAGGAAEGESDRGRRRR